MIEETRIYVIVAETIQVFAPIHRVIQPAGRQIAQACHVVSKLRHDMLERIHAEVVVYSFEPITTIILQARDSNEMFHVHRLLRKKKLNPVVFSDTNEYVYGPGEWETAIAVFATKKQTEGILDYLPLWGAQ